MANQWGDDRIADRQIESSRAATNRDIAIEGNGWKGDLADTFKQMGLAAQKQSYLERNNKAKAANAAAVRDEQRGYDEGVLASTRKYDEEIAAKEAEANAPAAQADIEGKQADTAKTLAEAKKIEKEIATGKVGSTKMRDIDKIDLRDAYDVLNDSEALPAVKEAAAADIKYIRSQYDGALSRKAKEILQLKAKKAAAAAADAAAQAAQAAPPVAPKASGGFMEGTAVGDIVNSEWLSKLISKYNAYSSEREKTYGGE